MKKLWTKKNGTKLQKIRKGGKERKRWKDAKCSKGGNEWAKPYKYIVSQWKTLIFFFLIVISANTTQTQRKNLAKTRSKLCPNYTCFWNSCNWLWLSAVRRSKPPKYVLSQTSTYVKVKNLFLCEKQIMTPSTTHTKKPSTDLRGLMSSKANSSVDYFIPGNC